MFKSFSIVHGVPIFLIGILLSFPLLPSAGGIGRVVSEKQGKIIKTYFVVVFI